MSLRNFLPLFEGRRVLVAGDLYLDEYIIGKPIRISREAPIPVLEFEEQRLMPGGATSPACNIASLGGKAGMLGVIGNDTAGQDLTRMLLARGVDTAGLVIDPHRPTTTKTRIVAEAAHIFPQQVARIDRMDRSPISGEVEQSAIKYLQTVLPRYDALLFSDYKAGVISPALIQAGLGAAAEAGKLVTVDSQGGLDKFRGCSLVKCNNTEASDYLRRDLTSDADFERALIELKQELAARMVVITRGSDGMSILDEPQGINHLPTYNRSEVFDVTGAGDTVIAVLTIGLVAGLSLLEAAQIANAAAGVVIRKQGNVNISLTELNRELEKLGL